MAALKRSALGRGLDALITMDDLKTGGSSSISEIELSKIQPNPEQPRSVFEEETLEELATSIRSLGVIQPITLKEIGPEQYNAVIVRRLKQVWSVFPLILRRRPTRTWWRWL